MIKANTDTICSTSFPEANRKRSCQKKFSPKVRTGCDNCKKRRVKCDERKPECLRCQRVGVQCSGYTVVEAKVFQPSMLPKEASHRFNVIDIRPTEDDSVYHFSQPTNEGFLRMLTKSYSTLHNIRPSNLPYQKSEDRAAFGFCVSWTGPMFNAYGPNGAVLLGSHTFLISLQTNFRVDVDKVDTPIHLPLTNHPQAPPRSHYRRRTMDQYRPSPTHRLCTSSSDILHLRSQRHNCWPHK